MFRIGTSFLLCSLLCIIFPRTVQGILGGEEAYHGQYSFTVVLKRDGQYYCSGGIIGEHYIVTAAHCIVNDGNEEFKNLPLQVIAGTNNFKISFLEGTVVADVERYFIPAEFFETKPLAERTGDIAVLKLKQRLNLKRTNMFLERLFLSEHKSYVGQTALLTGFGWDSLKYQIKPWSNKAVKLGGSSGKLRAVETTVLPPLDCIVGDRKRVHSIRHMCARVKQQKPTEPRGFCYGDSGAPLIHGDDLLIGVASLGNKRCNETQTPGVYTRVSYYVEFIQKVMRDDVENDILDDIHTATLPTTSWAW
ncbi:hypothetical protein QAD02_015292 [Eretmocerus hayati]|uniref:Uncharacterized protein n=1 Tax=Eretmocerus hayati TaxID=131215 RepID=A0ACC2P7W1_9HYME|nr:hypothetical protein QAD02_015292 [Eretmocerus hayati]